MGSSYLREMKIGIEFGAGFGKLFTANQTADQFKSKITAVQVATNQLGAIATRAGIAVKAAFGKMKTSVMSSLETLEKYKMELGMIAAFGAAAIISSVNAAGNANETLNKFQVVFKDTWKETIPWVEKYSSAVGRSKWETYDWLSSFGAVFSQTGKTSQEVTSLSKRMVKMGIDLGSLYNRKPSEAVDMLTSALVGNHEAVRSLNIILTDEDVKQFAMRSGIIKTKRELTSAEKVMARYGLILERGAVANDDATNTAKSYNNQLVMMQSNIKDLQVEFGQYYLPVFNNVLISTNEFIRALKQGEKLKTATKIIAIATAVFGVAAALGAVRAAWPFIKAIFFNPKSLLLSVAIIGLILIIQDLWICLKGGKGVLSPIVDWFRRWEPYIKAVGIILSTLFVASKIITVATALLKIGKAISFFGWTLKYHFLTSIWPTIAAIWQFSIALWACPITWIIAGVILLGIGLYLLITRWDDVKKASSRAMDSVSSYFHKLPAWAKLCVRAFLPFVYYAVLIHDNWAKLKTFFIKLGQWFIDYWKTVFNIIWAITPPWIRSMLDLASKGIKVFGMDKLFTDKKHNTQGGTLNAPKGLKTNNDNDSKASKITLAGSNEKIVQNNKKISVETIKILVDGSKNPAETSKQIKKDLDLYFGQELSGTTLDLDY